MEVPQFKEFRNAKHGTTMIDTFWTLYKSYGVLNFKELKRARKIYFKRDENNFVVPLSRHHVD